MARQRSYSSLCVMPHLLDGCTCCIFANLLLDQNIFYKEFLKCFVLSFFSVMILPVYKQMYFPAVADLAIIQHLEINEILYKHSWSPDDESC